MDTAQNNPLRQRLQTIWQGCPCPLYLPFMLAAILLVGLNTFFAYQETSKLLRIRAVLPPQFPGLKFAGLNTLLPKEQFIGYYTDKDLDDKANAAQFAQAQYVLAPLILQKGEKDFEYVLFDCTSPEAAHREIDALKFTAIKQNRFGIILARNPAVVPTQKGKRP